MKITKVNTKGGRFGSPVTTELNAIVERMRSPKTQEAAERIAATALRSRIAIEQGAPRFLLGDADRLPYLIFSATFGKAGFEKPKSLTGLVLLNMPCPQDYRQVEELKRRVSQIPYTLLAFAGVSGVTLKVVVKCEYDSSSDYLAFLKDAHESAARLYTSLAMCNLLVGERIRRDQGGDQIPGASAVDLFDEFVGRVAAVFRFADGGTVVVHFPGLLRNGALFDEAVHERLDRGVLPVRLFLQSFADLRNGKRVFRLPEHPHDLELGVADLLDRSERHGPYLLINKITRVVWI